MRATTGTHPGPNGRAPLATARTVALRVRDDEAVGTFAPPDGAFAGDTFAFPFSYTNADRRAVYTAPADVPEKPEIHAPVWSAP